METTILYIIIGIITAEFILERVLSYLNIQKMKKALPLELQGIYDDEEYIKSQKYQAEKDKIGLYSSTVSYIFTLTFLLVGGYGWLDRFASSFTETVTTTALVFFALLALISEIISIPFELYNIFVIEEKYGFNKMTGKTFVMDKFKSWLLAAAIGGLLIAAFIWFYQAFPDTFWIYAWGMFISIALFFSMFYANVIAPIFNKLTPLQEGELKGAIQAYAIKENFPLKKIMVMDGSKRSTKANAYFSGLGKNKNIVLYDTLIEKLTTDEIVAVIAHEVGHYKHKHTLQSLVLSALNMFITLYILSIFINSTELSLALKGDSLKIHLNLLAFTMLYSPLSLFTGILLNIFSRKNEFEADKFAAKTASSDELETALKKLTVDSLSNLTPHAAYVFVHYSHPPLLSRIKAMRKVAA